MVASYPDTVPNFTTKTDQTDVNWAADINRVQEEINAIAAELGTVPKAGFADVAARLQHFQDTKSDVTHLHDDRYLTRALVTSKGALLVGTSANNATALAVGTDGQTIVADSAQPGGVRWRTMTHADLPDLNADQHTQYLNEARHAAVNHGPLLAVASIRDLGDVASAAPQTGWALIWNGSQYTPQALPTYAATGHNHDANYVNEGDHTTGAHNAMSIDHGSLAGRSDNDHPQYARKASAETISGAWSFSTHPFINSQPVVVGMEGTTRIFVRSTTPPGSVSEGDVWFIP